MSWNQPESCPSGDTETAIAYKCHACGNRWQAPAIYEEDTGACYLSDEDDEICSECGEMGVEL